jgi:hypothetical protein
MAVGKQSRYFHRQPKVLARQQEPRQEKQWHEVTFQGLKPLPRYEVLQVKV